MRTHAALLAAAIAALAAGAALAQTAKPAPTPDAMTVARGSRIISELEIASAKDDYRLVGQVRSVAFSPGKEKEQAFVLSLAQGKTYKLVAACDDDCDGLDMKAERDDHTMASDISPEPVAMIDISSTGTASSVTATVIFGKCAKDPCVAALALFEKKR